MLLYDHPNDPLLHVLHCWLQDPQQLSVAFRYHRTPFPCNIVHRGVPVQFRHAAFAIEHEVEQDPAQQFHVCDHPQLPALYPLGVHILQVFALHPHTGLAHTEHEVLLYDHHNVPSLQVLIWDVQLLQHATDAVLYAVTDDQ